MTIAPTGLTAAGIEELLPLAPLQASMLSQETDLSNTSINMVQQVYLVNGSVTVDHIADRWAAVVRRHDGLRTRFAWRGLRSPVQIVAAAPQADLAVERHLTLEECLAEDHGRGFDLERGPLSRLIAHQSPDGWRLILSFHHAALDGWSAALVAGELVGGALEPEHQARYGDYFRWLRSTDNRAALQFWRADLGSVGPPTLVSGTGDLGYGRPETTSWKLAPATYRELRTIARNHGLTLGTIVQSCWGLALGDHLQERDVVFGVVTSGRPADLVNSDAIVGMLMNTLPARIGIRPDLPFSRWAREFQRRQAERREWQWLPLSAVRGCAPRGSRRLFDTIITMENYPHGVPDGHAWWLTFERTIENNGFPLTLSVGAEPALAVEYRYDPAALSGREVDLLAERFAMAVEQVSRRPEALLGAFDAPCRNPARQDGRSVDRGQATLHGLVEAQCDRLPEAVAVQTRHGVATYRDLDIRANRIAHRLRRQGVSPRSAVGIYLTRTEDLVVAMLGVLKAGCAYVPLDPRYPRARLNAMVARSGLGAVVTHSQLRDESRPWLSEVLHRQCLVVDDPTLHEEEDARPRFAVNPLHLAYMVFTSGSTGTPKGVAVPHRGVVNHVLGLGETLELGPDDVVSALTSISFDPSVREIFGALAHGARVALIGDEESRVPSLLARGLREAEVTVVPAIVPSLLEQLVDHLSGDYAVRVLVTCGESLRVALAARTESQLGCRVASMYGPTESSLAASLAWHTDADDAGDGAILPLGQPLPNYAVCLLDNLLRPVPQGTIGQIHVGGAGVTRGYHLQPRETAAVFLPGALGGSAGGRMYATGDFARQLDDSTLMFAGRRDNQIKVNGVRLDLAEVDAAMRGVPGVRAAATVVTGDRRKRIAAFAVLDEGTDADTVRRAVRHQLPPALVPDRVLAVGSIPRLPNGKLDRQTLISMLPVERELVESRPPISPEEVSVAALWSEVLGNGPSTVDDDFFAVGGDSLQLATVWSRLGTDFGADLSLNSMMYVTTVREQARQCSHPPASSATCADVVRMVPIRLTARPGHDGRVVAFHDGTGSLSHFAALTSNTLGDLPWYGITVTGMLPSDTALTDLQDRYTELTLRSGRQPLSLVGYSMGGVIAAGVADRLATAGSTVRRLVLIDAMPPRAADLPERLLRRAALEAIARADSAEEISRWLPEAEFPADAIALSPSSLRRLLHQRRVLNEAMISAAPADQPASGYPGRTLLIVAGKPGSPRVAEIESAWRPRYPALEVRTIDSTHHRMFQADSIQKLTDLVDIALKAP
ncbi:non-ribosomal peptide synthetase [Polymorphospora rubra]|uniref:non-ribosomal peptide synthetase n=1 Tax=Polymorphospora rubra TaxID=338584 RepID=UPI0033E43B78